MSSKMMIRSCNSSIRPLINRHLRLTAASTNLQSKPPGSIYSWQYLLPTVIASQPAYFSHGIGNGAAGFSVVKEAARGRRKENSDEEGVTDDEDDDDIEMDNWEFDDDDSEFDSEDDSELDNDDS